MNFPIYLDHHATTPVDPKVIDEMLPYFSKTFGNASSVDHTFGYDASVAVENARDKIAQSIGARHDEIIFTSGATEANNLAIIGAMMKNKERGDHFITCTTEHKAILDTAKYLEKLGKKVTYLPVNQYGEINLDDLSNSITDETLMISIMTANNEIGTIADVKQIGKIAHERNVYFHTDAAQAVGHIPMNVKEMNIDLMSMSSHKMYGPKGIGALYVRSDEPMVMLEPIVHGGGQEENLRSGTLNVPGIVGFGKAVEIAQKEMTVENQIYEKWTKSMLEKFQDLDGKQNGHPEKRLHHNLNVRFDGIESKAIINTVSKKIAISAGSACTTEIVEPSHVLLAIGLNESQTHNSIRFGCGRFNTDEEIETATNEVYSAVKLLKKIRI